MKRLAIGLAVACVAIWSYNIGTMTTLIIEDDRLTREEAR